MTQFTVVFKSNIFSVLIISFLFIYMAAYN